MNLKLVLERRDKTRQPSYLAGGVVRVDDSFGPRLEYLFRGRFQGFRRALFVLFFNGRQHRPGSRANAALPPPVVLLAIQTFPVPFLR